MFSGRRFSELPSRTPAGVWGLRGVSNSLEKHAVPCDSDLGEPRAPPHPSPSSPATWGQNATCRACAGARGQQEPGVSGVSCAPAPAPGGGGRGSCSRRALLPQGRAAQETQFKPRPIGVPGGGSSETPGDPETSRGWKAELCSRAGGPQPEAPLSRVTPGRLWPLCARFLCLHGVIGSAQCLQLMSKRGS